MHTLKTQHVPPSRVRLWRNLQRLVPSIENHILRSKQHIPIDLQVRTAIALHAAEARVRIHLGEGDSRTGHNGHVIGADVDAEVWDGGVAGIGEAADLRIKGCAGDGGVVGVCYGVVDEEEGCACVCCVGRLVVHDFER